MQEKMNINLRIVTPDDKEFCRRVHHLAYHDVIVRQFGLWNDAMQDSFFEKNWNSLTLKIIEVDGQDVGYFSREIRHDAISINQIELLPQFQKRRIGTKLLEQQLHEARSLNLPVRLHVLRENRARQLYERLGFILIGKTETHYLMEWTDHKTTQ
jgi:ribosomal protein S18 acetylase RimI-like enzyme